METVTRIGYLICKIYPKKVHGFNRGQIQSGRDDKERLQKIMDTTKDLSVEPEETEISLPAEGGIYQAVPQGTGE